MPQAKVDIDLLDFVKTGNFGFLKLGEAKSEILNQGFHPENWLNGETKETSRIWKYGNIELHFDNGNHLSGIFTDHLSNIDCGERISISNWWILSNGRTQPDLLSTLRELNRLNLGYTKTIFNIGYIEVSLYNGVYFSFDHPDEMPDEEHNKWTMSVIGKK